MKEQIEKLASTDSTEYMEALVAIRNAIHAGDEIELTEQDFTLALRPYYHWHHEVGGFQDIYDNANDTLKVYVKHLDKLSDMDKGPVQMLMMYVENGALDGSAFSYIASSIEIAAYSDLSSFADEVDDKAEKETVMKCAGNMRMLASMVGVAETLIGSIGHKHIETLYDMAITFAPSYHQSILQAFSYKDELKGNSDLIEFHKKFIKEGPDFFRELAQENLEQLEA